MAGMECIPKKKTKRVRLFSLDVCGRIILDAPSVLDWDGFEQIGFNNKVEAGDEEEIINTDGELCYYDLGCPKDKGVEVSFTECRENIVFAAMAGFGSLVLSPPPAATVDLPAGSVVGFDRNSINCDAAVALEILFATPTLCDDTGVELCVSRLFPYVSLFNDSNQRLINGVNVVRGTYTATAKKNGRVFENYPADTPDGELAYLAPWFETFLAGNAFYYDRLVVCPTLDAPRDCTLREVITTPVIP